MHQKYHLATQVNSNPPFLVLFPNSRMAADSTMFRIVNLLMALSFGVHLEQLLHLTGLT